ncbi:DNA/RNA helicase [Leucobacter sp. cx-42]|uniref:DNA/RNA helicase n=1 Tax=unclassified Leucobacter TaxID=2621730 RepID=UPI00165E50AB|nr:MULTISPECIES: DNA/RNA helicase [unclassified Leucobacter]MBC9955290.1 DNA/RNA helicase [Leucobacter sp. cx-42]
MKLSRKRRRELRRLRAEAQELLDQQRVVLGQAGEVLNHAGRQARHLSDEHLAPRVEKTWNRVRPGVETGIENARRTAEQVRIATAPMVTNALQGTIRTLDRFENQNAAKQVRRFGERTGYIAPAKKRSGAGKWIAISLGVAAATAVGVLLTRAFSTDEDLWVSAEG